MDNFTCAIIDDEQQAIDLLRYSLNGLYKNVQVSATCTKWTAALELLREQAFDIIFLDISIHGRSGMELLKFLPQLQSEVIFVTAYADYALEAFRLHAGGYIVKPIDESELVLTLDKAIERVKNKRLALVHPRPAADIISKIGIPDGNAIEYINTGDIVYLQAAHAYTRVVTTHHELTSSYNIGRYRQVLDNRLFYQVHRSYLVNLNHVSRYETSGSIVMDNAAAIPVARNFRDEFLKLFTRARHDDPPE